MTDADQRFARTAAAVCPYSGLTVWSCHMREICDCFDYPEVEVAVATYNESRGARYPDEWPNEETEEDP